jgi:hypothetical protein
MPPDSSLLANTTSAQRIAMWLEMMRTGEALLIAGMRHRLGTDADLRKEFRRWYEDHMREHDKVVERVATRLSACKQEPSHAR